MLPKKKENKQVHFNRKFSLINIPTGLFLDISNDKDDVTKIYVHLLVMSKHCAMWEQNVSPDNQQSINVETINNDKKLSTRTS